MHVVRAWCRNTKGTLRIWYRMAVLPVEYRDPAFRQYAEAEVERRLRRVEGVPPDAVVHVGWYLVDLARPGQTEALP
jgi:hypothetical protein